MLNWLKRHDTPIVAVAGIAWLVCYAFLVGRADQRQKDRKQIETTYQACDAIQKNYGAQEGRQTSNFPCRPRANEEGEDASDVTFIGLKLSDSLLIFVTAMLWLATRALVRGGEKTAERQLRAYVAIQPANVGTISPERRSVFSFYEINNGLTPAYGAIHSGIIDLLPYPLPDSFVFPPQVPAPNASRQSVYPRVMVPPTCRIVATRPFTQAEWVEILDPRSRRRLYILGQISYKDCFRRDRWTRFCFSLQGRVELAQLAQQGNWAAIGQITSATQGSLGFEPAPQHNESEEG